MGNKICLPLCTNDELDECQCIYVRSQSHYEIFNQYSQKLQGEFYPVRKPHGTNFLISQKKIKVICQCFSNPNILSPRRFSEGFQPKKIADTYTQIIQQESFIESQEKYKTWVLLNTLSISGSLSYTESLTSFSTSKYNLDILSINKEIQKYSTLIENLQMKKASLLTQLNDNNTEEETKEQIKDKISKDYNQCIDIYKFRQERLMKDRETISNKLILEKQNQSQFSEI